MEEAWRQKRAEGKGRGQKRVKEGNGWQKRVEEGSRRQKVVEKVLFPRATYAQCVHLSSEERVHCACASLQEIIITPSRSTRGLSI